MITYDCLRLSFVFIHSFLSLFLYICVVEWPVLFWATAITFPDLVLCRYTRTMCVYIVNRYRIVIISRYIYIYIQLYL